MKFQISRAQDLSGKLASFTFQINMLAEISKIMLIENDKQPKNLTNILGHITVSLDLYEFPDEKVCERLDETDNLIYKFRNYPSIVKLKERYKVRGNLSFKLATTEEMKTSIKDLLRIKQLGVKYQ